MTQEMTDEQAIRLHDILWPEDAGSWTAEKKVDFVRRHDPETADSFLTYLRSPEAKADFDSKFWDAPDPREEIRKEARERCAKVAERCGWHTDADKYRSGAFDLTIAFKSTYELLCEQRGVTP